MRQLFSGLVSTIAVLITGCGATGGSFGSDIAKQVDVVTRGGDFQGTIDATPTADGRIVYFTATGPNGPGVFTVAAAGGRAEPVHTGSPFRRPVGIAAGTDGRRVYVADPEAGAGGTVFAVSRVGGEATAVAGTEGLAPRGVEVVREGNGDVLYFTGRDGGAGAVFKVPLDGSARATPVMTGPPLVDPDGVTATRNGVVYVTDRGRDTGAVYRITGGSAQRIAGIRAPTLAGVTLTLDESTLLVSALSEKGTDQVVVIDVATLRTGTFSETIGANREGGGLHRAHDVNVFAWADLAAGPDRQGRVYVLRP